MNNLKYFFQFILIILIFFILKILPLKVSSILSGNIFLLFGRLFRPNKIPIENLSRALPDLKIEQKKKLLNKMWFNYGRIFSEYNYIKNFRYSVKFQNKIQVENQKILEDIKIKNEPVIFISGHFNNFELMAMHIEKSGIDLATIYRPLNNKFLNPLMESIRKKFICKKQVKKGISGTKEILKYFKNKTSIALMIDQRVSQGISCNFFNEKALTTTIPAQFVKKFNAKIVPVYIERIKDDYFKLIFYDPLNFEQEKTIEEITLQLNKILEKMICKNPEQWIWTHNRWKI